uniref:MCAfunc domain-containing protein n=1 Tax=Oryza brachyantha TaxID=4533 RepID=J3LK59_ORYBR
MASWENLGEVATVVQLTGLDAGRLISMAASTARLHKRNCRRFAQHLKLIGGLLEQLRVSELKKYPETREPLEQLEDALRRAYLLVHSCQDRSYLYLLAMGWNIVYQFRKAQNEIDNYLRLVPLITLVDNARVRERMEYIERDQCEYSFDEEDKEVQDALLNPDPSTNPTVVLKKTLSCSYPNLPFNEALRKESEKLQVELQRSQSNMDMGQCEVIQHLLGVTKTVASSIPDKCATPKVSEKCDSNLTKINEESAKTYDDDSPKKQKDACGAPRSSLPSSYGHDLVSSRGSYSDEWHADLLGCCTEPSLCLRTFFFPCGTFSRIASIAKNRPISSSEACNDIMAYSLILSCCCYTCCVRRKLRQKLNIAGGCIDDFLSHLMCCCCALVQEWREVEIRGAYDETKISPPSFQYMEH